MRRRRTRLLFMSCLAGLGLWIAPAASMRGQAPDEPASSHAPACLSETVVPGAQDVRALQMEITNSCPSALTAFVFRISCKNPASGTESRYQDATEDFFPSIGYEALIPWPPAAPVGGVLPGKTATRPAPNPCPAQSPSALAVSLVGAVFADRSAAGDRTALNKLMEIRQLRLEERRYWVRTLEHSVPPGRESVSLDFLNAIHQRRLQLLDQDGTAWLVAKSEGEEILRWLRHAPENRGNPGKAARISIDRALGYLRGNVAEKEKHVFLLR